MRKIIGLLGFIGSGKNTVGDLFAKSDLVHEAFAKPLKDATAAIFGWPRDFLEGDTPHSRQWREERDDWWSKKLDRDIVPRNILQHFGTEHFRNHFHPDIWILSLIRRIETQPDTDFVITDTRFPNEIETIRQLGGKIVLVERGEKPAWYDMALAYNRNPNAGLPKPDVHFSEWAWIGSEIDYTIKNDGTMVELIESVEKTIDIFYGE